MLWILSRIKMKVRLFELKALHEWQKGLEKRVGPVRSVIMKRVFWIIGLLIPFVGAFAEWGDRYTPICRPGTRSLAKFNHIDNDGDKVITEKEWKRYFKRHSMTWKKKADRVFKDMILLAKLARKGSCKEVYEDKKILTEAAGKAGKDGYEKFMNYLDTHEGYWHINHFEVECKREIENTTLRE